MKTNGKVVVELHAFLISALDRGEWSASNTGRFIPRCKNPQYPLDRSCPCRKTNAGRLVTTLRYLRN